MNKKLKELRRTEERIKFAENAIKSSKLKIQKEKKVMELLNVLDDPKFYIKFEENAIESSRLLEEINARFFELLIDKGKLEKK